MDTFGWILEQVLRLVERKDFTPLPKRWVVERTFGWFYWCRRLSRDYECSTHSAEAWIYLASIRLLLRRLASENILFRHLLKDIMEYPSMAKIMYA